MAFLRAQCPSCSAVLKVGNLSLAGKKVKCPKCAKPFMMPEKVTEASVEATAVEKPAHSQQQETNAQRLPKDGSRKASKSGDDEARGEDPDNGRSSGLHEKNNRRLADRSGKKPPSFEKAIHDEEDVDRPARSSSRDDEDDDRPARRSRRDEEDLDDRPARRSRRDNEDDDRPSRQQRVKKKGNGGSKSRFWIAAGILLLIVAAGIVGFIWYTRSLDEGSVAKKPQVGPDPRSEVKVFNPRAQFKPEALTGNNKPEDDHRSVWVYLSEDGKRLAYSSRLIRGTEIWDIEGTPKKINSFAWLCFAFSPDGKRAVRSQANKVPELIEIQGEAVLGNIEMFTAIYFRTSDSVVAMHSLNTSLNGLHVDVHDASAGWKKRSFVVDAGQGDCYISRPINHGKEFMIVGRGPATTKVVDFETGNVLRELNLPKQKNNGNQEQILVGSNSKIALLRYPDQLKIFDGADGKLLAALPNGIRMPDESLFLPDQNVYLSVSNIHRRENLRLVLDDIVAYDFGRKMVAAIFHGLEANYNCITISANGKVLAAADKNGNVLIWDVERLQ